MAAIGSALRNYDSGSSYDPASAYYNPYALGNRPFTVGTGGTATGMSSGIPPPPATMWGAQNPAYQTWTAGQQQNAPSQIQAQAFGERRQLAGEQWNRVMEFLKQLGLLQPGGGGGLSSGLQQFAGQASALKAEPAIRSYENIKRDVANRMGARGMGLSSAADMASGQAYGDLARALAEAGTYGDVAAQGLQYGLLGDILRSAVGGY